MINKSMYTLYILHSKSLDRYYVGYTNDLTRRLNEHNRIKGKFTDVGIPWVLVYKETYVLLPSEVIFHLSDFIAGLAASPNEADSLIKFKYFFDWQRLFLLLRDEDMLHGNTQHFSFLNSNFFGVTPMLPDIYPAYIIPIL
jgi:hypothetical protein